MFSRLMLTAAATAGLALPAMADTRAVQAQAMPHAHGATTAQAAPAHVKPGATAAAPATPATLATPSANAGKQAGTATPAMPGATVATPTAKAPAVAATPAVPGAARTN